MEENLVPHTEEKVVALFNVGQRVGIVSGLQAVGGPKVVRYGTVIEVVEYWRGLLEYVVRDEQGEELVYRSFMLRADGAQ